MLHEQSSINDLPWEFIVKLASRCNINCTYCYMYNLGDESALFQPKFIDESIIQELAQKLKSYQARHGLPVIRIALHGGEPLLVGKSRFAFFCDVLYGQLGEALELYVQTNGTLVDDEWIEIFARHKIVVGLSIDGPPDIHDRYRLTHAGKGTFDDVWPALVKLNNAAFDRRVRFGGVISVVDPQQDAENYYLWMRDVAGIASFNVLLPDANWDNFEEIYSFDVEELKIYLIQLFECWWEDTTEWRPDISFFRDIISKIIGGNSSLCTLGSFRTLAVIIESDGSIRPHDVLRINGGYQSIPPNIAKNEIEDIFLNEDFKGAARQEFTANDVPCLTCPVFKYCGGGFVAHRFSTQRQYQNPSVYCAALYGLIDHVYWRVAANVGN